MILHGTSNEWISTMKCSKIILKKSQKMIHEFVYNSWGIKFDTFD